MRRPSKYYASLFVSAVREATAHNVQELVNAFIKLLVRENALSRFGEILRLVVSTLEHEGQSKELTVRTAAPLKTTAAQTLERAAKSAGFTEVRLAVDARLGGGVVLQASDRRVDMSVDGALGRLYETLVS